MTVIFFTKIFCPADTVRENVMTWPDTVISSPAPQSIITPSRNTSVSVVSGVKPDTVVVVVFDPGTSSNRWIVTVGAEALAAIVMVFPERVKAIPEPWARVTLLPPVRLMVRSDPLPSPAVRVWLSVRVVLVTLEIVPSLFRVNTGICVPLP